MKTRGSAIPAARHRVGPVATEPQFEKILHYIEIAKREGARCVWAASAPRPECGDGWFVEPTIFADVNNDMRIAQEEVFGPVLTVIQFDDDEEAIAIANDTPFGLAAGVWTTTSRARSRCRSGCRPARSGSTPIASSAISSPFGGFKESGIGRENGSKRSTNIWSRRASSSIRQPSISNPFTLQ